MRQPEAKASGWRFALEPRRSLPKRLIPAEEVQRRVLTMLARAGEAVVRATSAPVVVVGTDTGEALVRQLGVSAQEMGGRFLLATGGDQDDDAVALLEAVRQMAAHRPS